MNAGVLVLGRFLMVCAALASSAATVAGPETTKDLAYIRSRPIGARERVLSRLPIERQIRIVLRNRMTTNETVLGTSLLEKHSIACVRAATLEVMAAEPSSSASKLYALDLLLETTRTGRKLSTAETCAVDTQLSTLPMNNAVAPKLLEELSRVRAAGTRSTDCGSMKFPSREDACSDGRTRR